MSRTGHVAQYDTLAWCGRSCDDDDPSDPSEGECYACLDAIMVLGTKAMNRKLDVVAANMLRGKRGIIEASREVDAAIAHADRKDAELLNHGYGGGGAGTVTGLTPFIPVTRTVDAERPTVEQLHKDANQVLANHFGRNVPSHLEAVLLRLEAIALEMRRELAEKPRYRRASESVLMQFTDRWIALDVDIFFAPTDAWEVLVRDEIETAFRPRRLGKAPTG